MENHKIGDFVKIHTPAIDGGILDIGVYEIIGIDSSWGVLLKNLRYNTTSYSREHIFYQDQETKQYERIKKLKRILDEE